MKMFLLQAMNSLFLVSQRLGLIMYKIVVKDLIILVFQVGSTSPGIVEHYCSFLCDELQFVVLLFTKIMLVTAWTSTHISRRTGSNRYEKCGLNPFPKASPWDDIKRVLNLAKDHISIYNTHKY